MIAAVDAAGDSADTTGVAGATADFAGNAVDADPDRLLQWQGCF